MKTLVGIYEIMEYVEFYCVKKEIFQNQKVFTLKDENIVNVTVINVFGGFRFRA